MRPKQRKLAFDWALVVLALGLSALVIATSRSVTSGERMTRARHLLQVFRADDVTRVVLEKNAERWVVNKRAAQDDTGSRWQFVEPLQGDAEEATLDQLLRRAQFATWLRQLSAADVDRAAQGLESPRTVIGIEMGNIRYRLRLGGEAPSPAGARYLEVSGEGAPNQGVYVVSGSIADELDVDPDTLRIRQLIPYAGSALQRVEVAFGEQRVALERDARNGFGFRGRFGDARLGREAQDRLLLAFSRSQAERFLPIERARELQREEASAVVTIDLVPRQSDQPRARITIGGGCPDAPSLLVAVRHEPRPSAACIQSSRLDEMFTRPELLVDRALFRARLDEIERVHLSHDGRVLELVRAGDAFELRQPESGPVERLPAEQRLEQLLTQRGQLVEQGDPVALGLSPPSVVVTLELATSDEEGLQERVELGRALADGSVYARRQDDGAIVRLGPLAPRAFSVDALLLRELELLKLELADVSAVEVERGGVRWRLSQPERGRFDLLEPAGYRTDTALAEAWFEALRRIEARRWVAERDDGSFGFGAPELRASVTDTAGRSTRLVVGGRTSGGWFAELDVRPGVFVLDHDVVDTLSALVLDRAAFDLDPDRLERLWLRRGKFVVQLERVGNELIQIDAGSGEPLALEPPQIQALVDALGLVRPEAAVSLEAVPADFRQPLLEVRFSLDVDGERVERHYQIGVGDSYRDVSVYLARSVGERPVYAIPRQQIARVLAAL